MKETKMPRIGQMMIDFGYLTHSRLIRTDFGWFWVDLIWYEIDAKEYMNDDRHYWDMIKLAKRLELVEWENGVSYYEILMKL